MQPPAGRRGCQMPHPLSTHSRISREPPTVGARTEGRRQGSLGDLAPRSSRRGAVGDRGWSVALEDRGVTTGTRTPVPGAPTGCPHGCPPESPPPTESGLGTRLCYEHNIDEPHGRAGKSESLSPQSVLVPSRPAIKRKSKNKPASKKLIRNEFRCLWQKELRNAIIFSFNIVSTDSCEGNT